MTAVLRTYVGRASEHSVPVSVPVSGARTVPQRSVPAPSDTCIGTTAISAPTTATVPAISAVARRRFTGGVYQCAAMRSAPVPHDRRKRNTRERGRCGVADRRADVRMGFSEFATSRHHAAAATSDDPRWLSFGAGTTRAPR